MNTLLLLVSLTEFSVKSTDQDRRHQNHTDHQWEPNPNMVQIFLNLEIDHRLEVNSPDQREATTGLMTVKSIPIHQHIQAPQIQ